VQVLKREGSAVAGTSAGAVEETVVEEEEETARAGQIIMRGE
jgi:cyanophycinase-like exopeptidase